ncbi:hypothetical protein FACS1894103_3940 [Campylobacterota bacterium]|nr:hypothetical protein FACS1894103_3940 [Campylobacterota bacterium]
MKKVSIFKSLSVLGLMIAGAFVFSGCATLFNGNPQSISFDSKPQGASIKLDGVTHCTTPCTAQVARKVKSVTVERNGYQTVNRNLTSTINPWFWGNIILGGLVGSTTDAATGSMNEFSPNNYFVELSPATAPAN